jgi:arginase
MSEPHRTRPYRIVQAPSILGLKPTGVELLGDRLLQEGLAQRLQAEVTAQLETPPYDPAVDPKTKTLNAQAMATWSPTLADAVQAVRRDGGFPLVLGGDCSIILGTMLALRREGRRYGLLFIDGHADFYQPEVNPNGEAASMDLAFATGYGPDLLTDIEGRKPLVRSSDVVVYGFRDAAEQQEYHSQPLPRDVRAIDLREVRKLGADGAARAAIAHLCRDDLDGFFIHLDADCLDDAVMPAVDYRIPGGLSADELVAVLRAALASGRVAGMEVTIYNPNLDTDGSAGRLLTDIIARGLGTAAPATAA